MASGANRGAYYAGFPGLLQEAGIDFELMAGVSAGGIAAAWFAAGDPEAMVDSWRQADPWRIAPHPWMSFGRLRTVDRLIQEITLKTMDVRAARTAEAEVVVAAARVVGPGLPLPRLEPAYFEIVKLRMTSAFGLMLRATAFVPYINGLRGAVSIDGERYMDGGLIHRVPLDLDPRGAVRRAVDRGMFAERAPRAQGRARRESTARSVWSSSPRVENCRSDAGRWSGRRSARPSSSAAETSRPRSTGLSQPTNQSLSVVLNSPNPPIRRAYSFDGAGATLHIV